MVCLKGYSFCQACRESRRKDGRVLALDSINGPQDKGAEAKRSRTKVKFPYIKHAPHVQLPAPKNVVWWQDVGAACQDADGDSRALSSKRQHPFYKRNS